jgi:hypothetical protein
MNGFFVARNEQRPDRAVGITVLHTLSIRWRHMALVVLLFVFFIIVLLIAFFIFPPNKWVEWFVKKDKK